MRFSRIQALGLLLLVLLPVVLSGCGPAVIRVKEPARTTSRSIPLDGLEELDVELRMGVGELTVTGGAAGAMDGRFEFRPRGWEPRVTYERSDEASKALLRIDQSDVDGPTFGGAFAEWDVRVSDDVTTTIRVNTGVGKSTLDLGSMKLRSVDVDGGVGETTIDLGNVARNDMSIDIRGGVGAIVLRVPREAGVRVSGYRDGVGNFSAEGFDSRDDDALYNDAWDQPGAKRYDVRVNRGVGDVRIEQQ